MRYRYAVFVYGTVVVCLRI